VADLQDLPEPARKPGRSALNAGVEGRWCHVTRDKERQEECEEGEGRAERELDKEPRAASRALGRTRSTIGRLRTSGGKEHTLRPSQSCSTWRRARCRSPAPSRGPGRTHALDRSAFRAERLERNKRAGAYDLLEPQAGDKKHAREPIAPAVAEENSGPEGEAEHRAVELEVGRVDERERRWGEEEHELEDLSERAG